MTAFERVTFRLITQTAICTGALKFDFDNDDGWKAYMRNVELPANVDAATVLPRLRAKWYKRQVDPQFDVSSIAGGAKPPPLSSGRKESPASYRGGNGGAAPPPPPSSDLPPPPPAYFQQPLSFVTGLAQQASAALSSLLAKVQARFGGVSGTNGSGAGGKGKGGNSAGVGKTQQILFAQHVILLVLWLAYLQPLQRWVSLTAYRYFILLAMFSHAYKVWVTQGTPPLSLDGIKSWLLRTAPTTDFQYAMLCGMFASRPPILLMTLPLAVLAIYAAFKYASEHYSRSRLWQSYASVAHAWLLSKQSDAKVFNAAAEIGVAFLLIIQLFTANRNLMLTFCYWNILRTRYASPDCATQHRSVWRTIGAQVEPLFQMVPALRQPFGTLSRWFTRQM